MRCRECDVDFDAASDAEMHVSDVHGSEIEKKLMEFFPDAVEAMYDELIDEGERDFPQREIPTFDSLERVIRESGQQIKSE